VDASTAHKQRLVDRENKRRHFAKTAHITKLADISTDLPPAAHAELCSQYRIGRGRLLQVFIFENLHDSSTD
jgi:hypothetical protein